MTRRMAGLQGARFPAPALVAMLLAFSRAALLALGSLSCAPPLPCQGDAFARAARAYEAGDHRAAAGLFEQALAEPGAPEGAVLHNLGNCAFRLGRPGEALWHWRRALLRLPGDAETECNIAFAERRLGLEERAPGSPWQAIDLQLRRVPAGTLLGLAFVLQAAGLVGLVCVRRARARAAFMLLVLLGLGCGAWVVRARWFPGPLKGVVLRDGVVLQSAPAGAETTARLRAGEVVVVEDVSSGEVRVRSAAGVGFADRAAVGIVE